jgi:hypothetical protein
MHGTTLQRHHVDAAAIERIILSTRSKTQQEHFVMKYIVLFAAITEPVKANAVVIIVLFLTQARRYLA